jgi:cell division protein FtsB
MRCEMSAAFATRARSGRSGARRSAATRGGPAPIASAGARVRWDRLGRLAMLFVLAALVYLYLSAGIHMFSTWGQARHDSAAVSSMQHEHKALVRQHEALGKQASVEAQARRLGMMKPGEQQYVVSNLPNN